MDLEVHYQGYAQSPGILTLFYINRFHHEVVSARLTIPPKPLFRVYTYRDFLLHGEEFIVMYGELPDDGITRSRAKKLEVLQGFPVLVVGPWQR